MVRSKKIEEEDELDESDVDEESALDESESSDEENSDEEEMDVSLEGFVEDSLGSVSRVNIKDLFLKSEESAESAAGLGSISQQVDNLEGSLAGLAGDTPRRDEEIKVSYVAKPLYKEVIDTGYDIEENETRRRKIEEPIEARRVANDEMIALPTLAVFDAAPRRIGMMRTEEMEMERGTMGGDDSEIQNKYTVRDFKTERERMPWEQEKDHSKKYKMRDSGES